MASIARRSLPVLDRLPEQPACPYLGLRRPPLAYQVFFGGQYKTDGLQAKWLAPTDTFIELGAEAGSGRAAPGNDRNKNGSGATAVFAHIGNDIGDSGSWRFGLSYLRTGAAERGFEDEGLVSAFSGRSTMWIADAIYKWAPNGNSTRQNFKLQGEYLRRTESGTLAAGDAVGAFDSTQSGWYLQGVYQFMLRPGAWACAWTACNRAPRRSA
ncbi:hypothetical protein LP420_00325 [Massilia sp. B-10]|nr:hypothetical protein LP420_00325 [Massilia sp. B-10]